MDRNRVIVGLSGGVDSSVAALLLKEKGYEVFGVTMRQFRDENFSKDAEAVAKVLDIPFEIIDMTEAFRSKIMEPFAIKYRNGKTPNPCVHCNPLVKWAALDIASKKHDAFFMATGHYANIDEKNGRFAIKNSSTASKDQTYALSLLSQDMLSRTLMPLGGLEKDEVRRIAKEAGIPVADKADSQDICFIPDGDYAGFIERFTKKQCIPGKFVDKNGNFIAPSKGVEHYTIGQRKGLNIAMGHPVFVTGIDAVKNEVVIGENEDLFSDTFFCTDMHYMLGDDSHLPKKLLCKVRYAHKGTMCTLYKEGSYYRIVLEEPVRAITPGQEAVFFEDEYVYCAGEVTNECL